MDGKDKNLLVVQSTRPVSSPGQYWRPKEECSNPAKKCFISKLDELASGNGAGRQKAKVSSSGSFNVGRH